MPLTTERIAPGMYRLIDENGYLIASIHKNRHWPYSWILLSGHGQPGGAYRTLTAAVARANARWTS